MLKTSTQPGQLIVAAAIFLGLAIVLGTCGFSQLRASSQPPPQTENQQPGNNNAQREAPNKEPDKSFWKWLASIKHKTADDPVALFTAVLTIFTGLLFLVAIVQIGFLIHADKLAKEAGDTAKESTNIAKQALIAGQRAFISVSFRVNAAKDLKTGAITQYIFTPVWQNSGETPTRNMKNHINVGSFTTGMPDDWDFPDTWNSATLEKDRRYIPLSAFPKNTVDGQAISITVTDLYDIRDEKRFLYLWGWAEYSDVFPETKKHISRFAIRILVGGDVADPEKTSFSFPFIWKYNCSDEECTYQDFPVEWKAKVKLIDSYKF